MPDDQQVRVDHDAADPTYIGTHTANSHVDTFRRPTRDRLAAAFDKAVQPYDDTTTAWSDHWQNFLGCLYAHPVSDKIAKNVLYRKMKTGTFAIISEDLAPWKDDAMNALTLEKYAELLEQLFQPPSESKALKMTFQERKQSEREHFETYVRQKFRLWKRSHGETSRDWDELFTQLTNGLLNKKARLYMRRYRATQPPVISDYIKELGYYQNEMREKYLAGELAYPDIKGMESRDTYRALRLAQDVKVKDEPVCHLTESINALTLNKGKKPIICYKCGEEGHMQKECPRATSGLATAGINQVEEDTEQEINALYRHQGHTTGKPGPQPEKKGYYRRRNVFSQSHKRQGRIIAQLVQDEEGQLEVLQVDSEPEDTTQPENSTEDAVHFLA